MQHREPDPVTPAPFPRVLAGAALVLVLSLLPGLGDWVGLLHDVRDLVVLGAAVMAGRQA